MVIAALSALLAVFCSAFSWREAYAGLGMSLRVSVSLRVFFVSQIGKYIPGSVWPVLSQMEMARDRGYSRARAGAASVLSMLVGVVTSGSVACVVMLTRAPSALTDYWFVLLVVPAGIFVLTPPGLRMVIQPIGRVLHKEFDVSTIRGMRILYSCLWALVMWGLYGIHTWIILRDLGAAAAVSLSAAVGAFAFAWVIGFLVVLAPAGVGVREAVMVLALGGAVSTATAFAFAIVSRVILTLIDAAVACLGFLLGKDGHRRENTPRGATSSEG
jgi:uncharacterized membrane protein YbhN (UPF0104 family)